MAEMELLRVKIVEIRRKKQQAFQPDWPMVLYALGVGAVLWQEAKTL